MEHAALRHDMPVDGNAHTTGQEGALLSSIAWRHISYRIADYAYAGIVRASEHIM